MSDFGGGVSDFGCFASTYEQSTLMQRECDWAVDLQRYDPSIPNETARSICPDGSDRGADMANGNVKGIA
jgi:hypothetical protein